MLTLSAAIVSLRRPRIPLPALLGLDPSTGQELQKSFFFSSSLTSQRLALLKTMVKRSGQVVVVIGDRGSGKSTLIEQLVAGQACRRVRLRLKTACQERAPGSVPPRTALCIGRGAHPPAMVIDDAHRLSRPELKMLLRSTFDLQANPKFSSLLLFAEPDIRRHFEAMSRWMPPKAVIDKIYMTPLTEKQTDDYLCHRFKIAGYLARHPFTPQQVRTIFLVSGGLPGWINGEAFMLLKQLHAGRRRFRKPLFPWWPLGVNWRPLMVARHRWAGKLRPRRSMRCASPS